MITLDAGSRNAVFFNIYRQATALALALLLVIQPGLAQAQLAADTAAPINEQPSIGAAPNGVPLVGIAPVNGAGVSHNKYSDFNSDNRGVILNNSAVVGTSTLGGVVLGNPNLTPGNEAGLIINEVTSSNPSVLNGALEVHGNRADVVVANPNGITVDGLETINIERFSLTTGKPELNSTTGALERFNVNRGTITIEQLGLDSETATHTDITARVFEIMGRVKAGESLNFILGRNDIDYDSLLTTVKGPDGTLKPALALDAVEFGAMQAGRIFIMATEDGVGVNTPKDLVTDLNDIVVDSQGMARLKGATATTDITVTAPDILVEEGSTIHAGGNTSLTADNTITVEQNSSVGAANNVNINAPTLITAQNTVLAADLLADGTFGGTTGSLTIDATTAFNNSGFVSGHGVDIDNLQNSSTGFVQATGGDLLLVATVFNSGVLASSNTLTFNGVDLINSDVIVADGDIDLTATNSITNDHGLIESLSGDITITANTLNNLGSNQVTTTRTETFFQYKSGGIPEWMRQVTGSFYWRNAVDGGQASTHILVPNPDFIDSTGWSKTEWQTHAPTDAASWNTDEWTLYIPDEFQPAPGRSMIMILEADQLTGQTGGEILASNGDMTLTISDTLTNTNAVIAAAQDLAINGTASLVNTGTVLEERLLLDLDYGLATTIRHHGWANFDFGTQHIGKGPQLIDSNSKGRVGGTITAGDSLTGSLANAVLASQPASSAADLSGSSTLVVRRDGLDNSQQTRFNPSLFQPSTNPRYREEIRFEFVNVGAFYGSDYFLNQLGFDPDTFTKRLGDAYFDTRLIAREVMRQTGQRFLAGYSTDSQQMQALLDNAAAQGTALSLTPGITLSKEAVAALTQDIVWYEEEVIDGETVVVPRLYLASNSDAFGAVISAGGDLQLALSGDYIQQGSKLIAENIDVTADNILLTADIQVTGNGRAAIGSAIGEVAQVDATNDISFGATSTLALAGADLLANTIDLSATDTLTVGTAQAEQFATGSNGRAISTTSETRNIQSSITATDTLNLTSTNADVGLKAADLNADTVNVTGQNITIQTAKDATFNQVILQKESTFTQSSRNVGQIDETVLNTTIQANSLNLNAASAITAEVKQDGTLTETLAKATTQPGLSYLSQIPTQNIILVRENDEQWNDHTKGLNQTGGIILTAAITAATFGAGAALAPLTMATIAAQTAAATALINNQGDLDAAFKDFTTLDTVKNVGLAYVTAGLTQGFTFNTGTVVGDLVITEAAKSGISAGIRAGVTGEDLGEQLRQSLEFAGISLVGNTLAAGIGSISKGPNAISPAAQYTLHAAAGCATGAIQGNCGAGALGAVVGEATGEAYLEAGGRNRDFGKALAELTSATTAALAGTGDVAIAARAGGDAASNNALGKLVTTSVKVTGKAAQKLIQKGKITKEDLQNIGKEELLEIADAVATLADPSASTGEKALATVELIVGIEGKDVKQTLEVADDAADYLRGIHKLEKSGIDYTKISTAKKGQAVKPRDLNEQTLWNQVVRNPGSGRKLTNMNNDDKFLSKDGWQKMEAKHTLPDGEKITIHYQYNKHINQAYDMKITTPQRTPPSLQPATTAR